LLSKDKARRLGSKNDVDDVIRHDWFKDLDVEKLLKQEVSKY